MRPFSFFTRPNFKISFTLPRSVRTPFLLSYLFAAVSSFIAVGFYTQLPPVIPLLYTLAEPAAQLAAKEWVFIFPVFALVIGLSHTLIVRNLHEHGRVMAKLFALATVVVQLLLMMSIIRIIMIVT